MSRSIDKIVCYDHWLLAVWFYSANAKKNKLSKVHWIDRLIYFLFFGNQMIVVRIGERTVSTVQHS